ncbi:hypothetical protein HYH03_018712 [Edaphochlamys debaryana]|uniref:Uncharacterized protein n=1 Tax=Edaphochlamys debaryana TaxID=47281 RepID=A0A835XG15_9CHLO|nr:hypothetical protein HYH03_018712 [Edaphochlamys debaryana]|eukprot:KAG2482362.1 hypothetical protein HYH03_018712 [Edaphochlamys debaryana]
MLKRKRSSSCLGGDSPPDLHILVAGREEPLPAHRRVLSLFSGVVDGLPSNTDGSPTPWDLRGLVLDGESEPVAAAVVERWLDAVYSRLDVSRQLPAPATLEEARPLLLLADAVDTSPAVLQALGGALAERPDLALTVAVGELKLDLQLKGRLHCIVTGALEYCLEPTGSSSGSWHMLVAKETFDQHKDAFPSAVARELESWLHLAGRLNLVPLARALMGVVKAQLAPNTLSLLQSSVGSVFSPRVLHFMPRELMFEGFVRDALVERPAQVNILSGDVSIVMASPLAAAWYGKPLGSTAQGKAELHPDGRATPKIGNGGVAVTAFMGGPNPEACAKLVEEAVAKALEEE